MKALSFFFSKGRINRLSLLAGPIFPNFPHFIAVFLGVVEEDLI